jgi:hypothetical protein
LIVKIDLFGRNWGRCERVHGNQNDSAFE